MDRVLIGKFCSAQELGLYDRAYKLLMMPLNQFIYPLANLAMPVLSRLQKDPVRYRKVYLVCKKKCVSPSYLQSASFWLIMT